MKASHQHIETLNPSNAAVFIARCIEAGLTAFLHGRPGVGKSRIVEAIAEAAGVPCTVLSLSLMQPEDVRVPVPNKGGVVWHYTDALPRSGRGILFLDEFPQAHESVQAAFGQLLHLGRLDGYVLPPGWAIVCAGNRMEDMAAAHTIPTQIRNRCAHVEIETSSLDWAEYDSSHPVNLDSLQLPERKLTDGDPHPLFAAMVRVRGDLLATPPNWTELTAFPTPRTLSLASAYIRWAESSRAELDRIDWAIVSGLIGGPLAAEVRVWHEFRRHLPTMDEIMKGQPKVPDKPEARWFVAFSVADMATAGKPINRELFNRAMEYLDRLGIVYMVPAGKRMMKKLLDTGNLSLMSWEGAQLYTQRIRENNIAGV